jgi:nitroreductase
MVLHMSSDTAQLPLPAAAPDAAAQPNGRSLIRRSIGGVWRRTGLLWRWFVERLDGWCLKCASKSGFLASLYYAFWSSKLRREHLAVVRGKLRFRQDVARPIAGTSSVLRRSVHRLEKGLTMRPRRAIFGLDYIETAFGVYERVVTTPGILAEYSKDELRWAHDVFSDYFAVTGSHAKIDALRERFQSLAKPDLQGTTQGPPGRGCSQGRLIPYRRDLQTLPVAYEQLLALAMRRRSVRWFLGRAVPREEVDKAVSVATQSPSACNRQPFQFRIFDEPAMVRKVAGIPFGTAGYDHNIPVIVVVVGQLRFYSEERDRHLIYVDGSLASMSFVLALETLGLSSCCINWADIEDRERKMAETLKLDADERPIMLIAVGYPDPEGLVAYSQKKPVSLLRRYNFE